MHSHIHTQKIKLCLCHQVVKFGTGEGAVMPLLQISFYCKQSFSTHIFSSHFVAATNSHVEVVDYFPLLNNRIPFLSRPYKHHVKWIRITQSLRQPSFFDALLNITSLLQNNTAQQYRTRAAVDCGQSKIRLYMLHTPLFRTWIRYGAQWSRFCLPQLMLSLTKSNLCQADLESTIT